MKYLVGDKVKVRKLVENKSYGDFYNANSTMAKFSGRIVTISKVGSNSYHIAEDPNEYNWTDEMFTAYKPTQTEMLEKVLSESFDTFSNKLNESVEVGMNKINESINKRTMYDDILQQQILDKAKEISLEDLKSEFHDDMNKYIRENFGTIPKKIEVKNGRKTKKIEGIFHKDFETILQIVNKNVPLMLTGPAGAGKNYTLEQVAKALDLDFYFTNAITQEYKLTGFIDANGVYQETQFYKAFTQGGLFFLDEVDASIPEALIILNGAIANGYFDFPTGRENAHKDFRVVCAGNTYGTGADMIYVGRNALDGATLDRFVVINFDYDEEVEKQLSFNDELYSFIKNLREVISLCSLRYIISMRATINATKLLEIDVDKEEILKSVIIKNMQIDDMNTIINKISTDNEWGRTLKTVVERM